MSDEVLYVREGKCECKKGYKKVAGKSGCFQDLASSVVIDIPKLNNPSDPDCKSGVIILGSCYQLNLTPDKKCNKPHEVLIEGSCECQ